jgi:hypothetical protein
MEKGVTGTTYHFGAPKFTPGCSGVRVVRSLVFCVVFCCSFFVLLSFFFLLSNVFSVLRFADYDYPFGIFKLIILGFLYC